MATDSNRTFTLASRASKLAQIQTNAVTETLRALFPDGHFTTSFMTSIADRNPDVTLTALGGTNGGKSLWTSDLEASLLSGKVDLLVHCYKDMPTTLPEGCMIGAVLPREDPVDCLVVKQGETWTSFDELPEGSVVGTGSVRRGAQLRRKWPNLKVVDMVRSTYMHSSYVCLNRAAGQLVRLPPSHLRSLMALIMIYNAGTPDSQSSTRPRAPAPRSSSRKQEWCASASPHG